MAQAALVSRLELRVTNRTGYRLPDQAIKGLNSNRAEVMIIINQVMAVP